MYDRIVSLINPILGGGRQKTLKN